MYVCVSSTDHVRFQMALYFSQYMYYMYNLHDITEILLKVALNTISHPQYMHMLI